MKIRFDPAAAVCILLFMAYLLFGYFYFIDGVYVRKIATIRNISTSSEICITHATTKESYYRGEVVEATIMISKFREMEATLQWNLMDARFYSYSPRRGCVPIGDHTLVVQIERIPMHIPPGEYFFAGSAKYEPNFLRDLYIPIRTNKFVVR